MYEVVVGLPVLGRHPGVVRGIKFWLQICVTSVILWSFLRHLAPVLRHPCVIRNVRIDLILRGGDAGDGGDAVLHH